MKERLCKFFFSLILAASFFLFPTFVNAGPSYDGELNKVYDIGDEYAQFLATAGNITYFTLYSEETDRELWRTDGTELGTWLLKDINEGTESSDINYSYVVGDTIYFFAYTQEYGDELWKSNGTTEGTILVKDIYEGTDGDVFEFKASNIDNILYFMVDDGIHGRELWRSDGTEEGTWLVKDIVEGEDGIYAYNLTVYNNILYMFIDNEGSYELWKSDGTEEGTELVKALDGEFNYNEDAYIIYNNRIYFVTDDDSEGYEFLWKTDGTTAGTIKLSSSDLELGSITNIKGLSILDGSLYFYARSSVLRDRLFIVDSISNEFSLIEGDNFSNIFTGPDFVVLNDYMYFVASKNDSEFELWRTNGTNEGTELFIGTTYNEHIIYIHDLIVIVDKLYVLMDSSLATSLGEFAAMLLESDGTYEGTFVVADYLSYGEGPLPIYNSQDGIYFFQANEKLGPFWVSDNEIWKYNPNLPEYTVTFKDYNGNTIDTQIVEYNDNAVAPNNPTRIGYTFTGWDKTFENIKSNLTVTAQYSINTYTVVFKDYNGNILKNQTVAYGSNAVAPSNPTRNGYLFTGWNKSYNNVTQNLEIIALYSVIPVNNNSSNSNDDNDEEEQFEPELVINDVTKNINDTILNEIKNNIKILNENNEIISLYDINLLLNGEKIQPDGYMDVRILMTAEQKKYENLKVVYIDDNNEITIIPHSIEGNYIVFSVNHFSNYAVIGTKMVEIEKNDEKTISDIDNQEVGILNIFENHPVAFTIAILSLLLFIIFIVVKRRKKDVR